MELFNMEFAFLFTLLIISVPFRLELGLSSFIRMLAISLSEIYKFLYLPYKLVQFKPKKNVWSRICTKF
jgi:hypothetical protein